MVWSGIVQSAAVWFGLGWCSTVWNLAVWSGAERNGTSWYSTYSNCCTNNSEGQNIDLGQYLPTMV